MSLVKKTWGRINLNCNEVIFSKKILLKEGNQYKVYPGYIEISGNKIIKVEKLSLESYQESVKKEMESKKIPAHDFGDRLITPAFINCHTHIAMSFFRALLYNQIKSQNLIEDTFFKAESQLTESDVRAFARLGAYENILNGNGLIWDHYYYGKEVANACVDTGLTAVIAPTLQDVSGPGTHIQTQMLQETYDIHADAVLQKNCVFAALGPHATDTVSEKLWKEIKQISDKLNIPIHCHLAQSFDEVTRVFNKYKKTPVQFLHSLGITKNSASAMLVHGIFINPNDHHLLSDKHCALVFCPFSQMIFQFPSNIIEWELNNLKWFIATDCVASNDSMNLQKELKLIAGFPSFLNTFEKEHYIIKKYNNKTKSEIQAKKNLVKKLQIKFSNNTFLLNKILDGPGSFHKSFKAGLIKPNYLANLIIWDLNHPSMWPGENVTRCLVMGDTTGAIYNMCIGGKWLGKNGAFCQSIIESKNYKESLLEANSRLKILLKKL
ncbi:MAG: hypothetical protein DCC88_01765 [Spirobacillus cienkowskii]|jgi:5-methylthioadenosine/S-adenosylhomocysteine deaminase|uniref:Amidohydrolase-related domain-containing protein n=1 Tax=Spirobacillus cienkowskii TaxID=495820 RepID=A0A369KUR6_9BACT|nr:MAG: hypothetical protein DCC88_01765 [Spirobacillus cienkowskii]